MKFIVIFRKCFQNICENIFGMFAKIFSECLRKYFRNVCENSLVSTLQAGDEEAARITVTDSSFKGTVSRDLFNVLYLSINSMHVYTYHREGVKYFRIYKHELTVFTKQNKTLCCGISLRYRTIM